MKVSTHTEHLKEKKKYSTEEFFEIQKARLDKKFELINYEIVEMPGGHINHSRIATALIAAFYQIAQQVGGEAFFSEAGVAIPEADAFCYPDASLSRDAAQTLQRGGTHWLLNPFMVAEVLSPSSAERDRNVKREASQRIPSLQTYLLAEQEAPRAERYERAGDDWRHDVYEGLEAAFSVLGGAAELRLEDVYRGVNFDNQ